MSLLPFILLSLLGLGAIIALSAALYAALPRHVLDCAERHGRFHGLQQDQAVPNGTPTEALPEGTLTGHAALGALT